MVKKPHMKPVIIKHDMVLHCYGPLDFDEWSDPEEKSVVVN